MDEIIQFWFDELSPADWFAKNPQLDAAISARFAQRLSQAQHNELAAWRETALGSLAEILVLDQFSRNIFRDAPEAFASDAQAVALTQVAISKGFAETLTPLQRRFLYMPLMHSESRLIHQQALELFEQLGDATSLNYERQHKAIIDRFGRYPHRNHILGRVSTPEEVAFLQEPGSSF